MAVQPPTSLRTSHRFGGMRCMSPISPMFPGSPRAKVHFVLGIETSVQLTSPWKRDASASTKGSRSSNRRDARHAVDRELLKPSRHVKLDKESIFKPLRVRVRVDYFAEGIVGALRLWFVSIRHRVNKPSLSVHPWWSGWPLATSQGGRAGFPARSRWSAEGRNK
jgi:hypothetical protein